MGFPRQEYWSELLLFPSPGELPDPGIKPGSPASQAGSLPFESPEKPWKSMYLLKSIKCCVQDRGVSLYAILLKNKQNAWTLGYWYSYWRAKHELYWCLQFTSCIKKSNGWMEDRDGQTHDKANTTECKIYNLGAGDVLICCTVLSTFLYTWKFPLGTVGRKEARKKREMNLEYIINDEIPKGHFSKKWPFNMSVVWDFECIFHWYRPTETHLTWNMAKINSVFSFSSCSEILQSV